MGLGVWLKLHLTIDVRRSEGVQWATVLQGLLPADGATGSFCVLFLSHHSSTLSILNYRKLRADSLLTQPPTSLALYLYRCVIYYNYLTHSRTLKGIGKAQYS